MSSVNSSVLPATSAAEPPSTLRVKPSRKKPDASSGLKCLHCPKYFSTKYVLETHNRKCGGNVQNPSVNVNPRIKPYIKSSISSNALNESGPTTTCTVGTSADGLRQRRPRHPCSVCDKSFANKVDLVYHIKSYHTSVDVDTVCPFKPKTRYNGLVCPGQLIFARFEC